MLKKFAKAIKPDLSQIANSLYATAILYFAPTVGGAALVWLSSFDPLDLIVTKGQIMALLLYSIMAIGFGTLGYWFVRFIYRIFPPIALKFSTALDKEMKKSSFSGRGVIFLNDIKKAPPFLGIKFSKPLIQPEHEKVMTEYFMALDFFNKYGSSIKGGDTYQMKGEKTWEEISEKIYGSSKFVSYILSANRGVISPPPRGTIIRLPRVDVSGTTGLTPELIEHKHSILKSDVVSKTLVELTNNFNLVWDETLNLITLIWRTAVSSRSSKR
jgi:hypothetical protein